MRGSLSDARRIWFDLFEEYRDLGDVHFFSKIVKVGSGSNAVIEVTCTGSLSGFSKTNGLRVGTCESVICEVSV